MASRRRPFVSAFGLSLTAHAVAAAVVLMYMGVAPESVTTKAVPLPTNLVFIQETGPGGGGGGRHAEAARAPIEIPRPAAVIPAPAEHVPADPPPPALAVRVTTFDATSLQGGGVALSGAPGPGGRGPGGGLGDGKGDGAGPGNDKGLGGGDHAPGAATDPTVRLQVRPEYTNAALAAKVQGVVTLEAEVLPDGTVGTVRVLQSLDRVYGLDQAAIAAARKWRFVPGTVNGRAVATIVTLVLEFNLR